MYFYPSILYNLSTGLDQRMTATRWYLQGEEWLQLVVAIFSKEEQNGCHLLRLTK